MGTAPIAYLLFTRFLRHNPANPQLVQARSLRAVVRGLA
jgi:transketolase